MPGYMALNEDGTEMFFREPDNKKAIKFARAIWSHTRFQLFLLKGLPANRIRETDNLIYTRKFWYERLLPVWLVQKIFPNSASKIDAN